MDIAKNTDLPELLGHLGYQVKRVGRYYTIREMDSIRIKDRRTWKRYSNGTGGDAITFLQTFEGKDFRGAAWDGWAWARLCSAHYSPAGTPPPPGSPSPQMSGGK